MNISFQILSFLAAFLLFYLELLISKSLLPVLGGAYFVWVGCVVFFTLIMLVSNWVFTIIFEKLGDKYTFLTFFILGVGALLSFPFRIPKEPHGNEIIFIFITLSKNIGLPFFILSAASPILQKLSFNLDPRKNPYTLYGISNWGSLLALLFFPLILEPLFINYEKFLITYILYFLFIIIFGIILFLNFNNISNLKEETKGSLKFSWIFLSSSTTAFFLATTNYITYDIGSAPFFWAIPLGIFLLSFILNFKENPWRPKIFPYVLIAVAVIFDLVIKNFITQIFFHYAILFVTCFKLNQLLYDSRPPEKSLPSFYLSLSLGGLIGSFLILFSGPTVFKHNKLLSADFLLVLSLIIIGLWFHLGNFKGKRIITTIIFLVIFVFYGIGFFKNKNEYILRNYYGIYRIKANQRMKSLINGTTLHGTQDLLNPRLPLAYYSYNSPIGEILQSKNYENIASVGLGVGTLLAYGRINQVWDIIEIDPDVIDIAKNHFYYMNNCPSKLNLLIGDGRIVLNKQQNAKYDLIIIDAFSGDNIPFHLLSVDAIKIYLDKIKNGGLIAFHISNNYHDFIPLLTNTSLNFNLKYFFKGYQNKNHEIGVRTSIWFFMEKTFSPLEKTKLKPAPWTDSYYNFWDTLKLFR